MRWIRVENTQGAEEYVDSEKVVRIVFQVSKQTKQFSAALLYAIGGEGFVYLGAVRGDVSINELHERTTKLEREG